MTRFGKWTAINVLLENFARNRQIENIRLRMRRN
jgi:hypothetical protein